MSSLPVVHAVTNDEIVSRGLFLDLAKSVMEALGPRGAVHLRARTLSSRRLHELAAWLVAWEKETGCWAIVNDRVDVACAAGIAAVQLPASSMTPDDARKLNQRLRIGVSVHSAREAAAAAALRADWCVAGPAYRTDTHPAREPGGAHLIRDSAASVSIPVIAIGGIAPDRIGELRDAGAHGVAAISGIWGAQGHDVGKAARHYLSSYDEYEGVR